MSATKAVSSPDGPHRMKQGVRKVLALILLGSDLCVLKAYQIYFGAE